MKNSIMTGLLGLALAVGTSSASAATTTNVTSQVLTVKLTAQAQTGTNSITMGAVNNQVLLSFLGLPANAKLLLLKNVGAVARVTANGKTKDYAISPTSLYAENGGTSVTNPSTGYFLSALSVYAHSTNGALNAQFQGYTTETLATHATSAKVAGQGYINNYPALFEGTVSVGGRTTSSFASTNYTFVPVPVTAN